PRAAALYNRALAYRPDAPLLIASVVNLARAERLRQVLKRAAATAVGAVVIASALAAVARVGQQGTPAGISSANANSSAAPVPRPLPPASVSAAPPPASAQAETRSPPVPKPGRPAMGARREPASQGVAHVQIVVDGPQNATVRIDGVETPWFGEIQELAAGEHLFEFIPPDERCCEPGQPLRIAVPASEGPDDVRTIRGRIEFRPATLALSGPEGGTASCGTLGEFPVPSQQQIPMKVAAKRAICQLLPPPGSTDSPKEFDVVLSPGGISTYPGP
ncbi:MAG TPA: hypothetical protein VER33_08790, partial [Polyangiaceae bacterium]|nr:hypothetical protein [Polyangiaceae bacterium]